MMNVLILDNIYKHTWYLSREPREFSCKFFLACEKSRCFWENLHSWHKFYTTAGRDGRDKSQLCNDHYDDYGVLIDITTNNIMLRPAAVLTWYNGTSLFPEQPAGQVPKMILSVYLRWWMFWFWTIYIRMIFAARQFPQIIICFLIITNIRVLVRWWWQL